MMSNTRVVIVKEAQEMGKKIDKLESYVTNPSPQTILVLNHKYKKLDGRGKL